MACQVDHCRWRRPTCGGEAAGRTACSYVLYFQCKYKYSDKFDFRVGYRNLSYEFDHNSDEVDLTMAGLLLGVGISF